jgi:DNA-binding PadR family transcriptional regulator
VFVEEELSPFEVAVLSGIQKLNGNAVVSALLAELKKQTGRTTSARTLYAVLARLDGRGLLTFREADRSTVEGSRGRKLIRLTPTGIAALRAAAEGNARDSRLVRAILDGPGQRR